MFLVPLPILFNTLSLPRRLPGVLLVLSSHNMPSACVPRKRGRGAASHDERASCSPKKSRRDEPTRSNSSRKREASTFDVNGRPLKSHRGSPHVPRHAGAAAAAVRAPRPGDGVVLAHLRRQAACKILRCVKGDSVHSVVCKLLNNKDWRDQFQNLDVVARVEVADNLAERFYPGPTIVVL